MPVFVHKCIRRCYIDKKLYNIDEIAVSDKEELEHFELIGETVEKKPKKPKKPKKNEKD